MAVPNRRNRLHLFSTTLLLFFLLTPTNAFSSCTRIQQQPRRHHAALQLHVSNLKEPVTTTQHDNDTPSSSSVVATSSLEQHDSSIDIPTTTSQLDEHNSNGDGLIWRAAVVGLCAVWASNFPVIKLVVGNGNTIDSLLFAVARFSVAAAALLPFALRQSLTTTTPPPHILRGAAVCGSWVAFGYLGQLLGLLTTTASRSCVICTLHCVFVALVAEWMRVQDNTNQQFNVATLGPAALAVTGVAIVELQGAGGAPTMGDLLSFAQPIGFGIGYLKLEELMRESPESAVAVSTIKLCMVALASLVFYELQPLLLNDASSFALRIPDMTPILQSPIALGGVLYTGLITTALALYVESVAFRRVPATDASIILTTEPLFAAALGAVTLGETFGVSDYAGAALIVTACIAAVRMDHAKEEEEKEQVL